MIITCRKCKSHPLEWHQVQGIMLKREVDGIEVCDAICEHCGPMEIPVSQVKRWAGQATVKEPK